jgi:hypothetical protein
MFSRAVIENLNFYVYFLQDPRTSKVFYVGKGVENRVFDHVNCLIDNNDITEKLDQIREIRNAGLDVKHFILRHGLTEQTAFEIEASLIDYIGMDNLLNIQGGHYSSDYGLRTTNEITAMYEADELSTIEPLILVNINKLYDRKMTSLELYNATRKSWVVGPRREKPRYAVATYRGLTREVYKIEKWYPIEINGKIRWGFDADVANDVVRDKLIYKSIKTFFKRGAANPIKYLNC